MKKSTFRNQKRTGWIRILSMFIVLGLLLLGQFQVKAQVNAYSFATGTGATLDPMTGSTQLVGASSDDGAGALTNIGFTFTYAGVAHTQFSANVNGCVRLGALTSTASTFYTNSAANGNTGSPLILPYWDDLATGVGGKVHYLLTGSAPNRILKIEWFVTVPRATGGTAAARFQCWLSETTNSIQFIYGSGMAANSANSGYSIGLITATSVFNSVTSATNTNSISSFNTTQTNAISSGTFYTFTPPVPCTGTPTAGTIPATAGVCTTSPTTTLSVTGFTTGVTGITFQWQESATGLPGSFANVVGGTGATTASYTTASLASPNYYQCIVTCTASGLSATTNVCAVNIVACSFDVNYTTGATWNSIMPANGGSGNVYSGWQSATSSGDDNTSTTQSLAGTTFQFQGNTVTGFQACTNGWMTFNTANTSVQWTNDLTSAAQTRILAPFWEDLVLTGQVFSAANSCMRWQVIGTLGSGSAVIVMEWAGMERFNIAGPNLNFQVRLYEGSNNIEFVYGNFEGFDGTVTSNYSYSLGYNGTNPAGTTGSDRFAMQTAVTNHFSAASDPATHQVMPACFSKFTFTPGTYTGPVSAPVIPAPSNDNVANATTLSVNLSPCISYCGTYYTSQNATNSGFGPSTCGTAAGNEDDDVWFMFTTSAATDYTIRLRNSPGYDGVLQLLDASFAPITCVNATGAGLIETINATGLIGGGQTYYIRVFHNGVGIGGSGQFALCVSQVINPPTNDNICGATTLTTAVACAATNSQLPATLAATASPQAVCGGTPDDDVWYKFTAATASDLVTVQSASGYNAQIEVLSSSDNTCTGTLTSLGCINNSSTGGVETFSGTLTPGNTYFVRVYHNVTGAGSGNFSICVTAVAPSCITSPTSPADGGGSGACASGTVTLSWPSASGATGYDVYVDGSLVSTNQSALTYNAGVLSAGTHTWKIVARNGVGSASGCPTWSFSVTPLVCSAATLSIGGKCAGSNFTATANTTGGGSPYTYVWNDGIGGVYPNASSVTVNLPAGSYTLTCSVTDGCGSTCSSDVAVIINALPTVTLSSSSPVNCLPGSGITLTAGGALTYSYTPSTSLTPTTGSPVNANPTSATTYTVAGTDVNGCVNTATIAIAIGVTVTMNSVSASPNTFCHVGSSILTANASLPSTGYCTPSYTSFDGTDFISNVTLNDLNYTSSSTALPCYADYSATLGAHLVAGTTYTISITSGSFANESDAAWIDFDQNGVFDASELLGQAVSVPSFGVSSFVFTVPSGAYNGNTRLRVVDMFNVATVLPCPTSGFGESEDYFVSVSGGVNQVSPLTYAWSQSGSSTLGGSITNTESATNITANTTYTVVATSAAGCTASGSVSVTDAATASTINVNSPVSCYTWPVTGNSYSSNGTYTGTLMNAAGCDSIITMNLTVTPGVSLSAKAILAGCYDASLGLMHDSLRINGLVPSSEPYSVPPFNKPVLGVPNGETVSAGVLSLSGNNAIVDWVYLELRDAVSPSLIVATKRALIQRDGDIVSSIDGVSPVFFPGFASGNYYLSMKHRNHLGVMTASPIAIGACANGVIDFTTIPVWVKPGEMNAPRKMIGAVAALWAADANTNKNAKYNGLSNDKQEVLNAVGVGTPNNVIYSAYRPEDLNLDSKIKYNGLDNDRNVIANMVGVSTPNNIVNQHTPN